MDLILWRHAEAQPEREGLADIDRALTTKGERQAKRIAEWLERRLADSTRIVASPARRCQQTVAALGRDVETLQAIQSGAAVADVLKAVHWPDASEPVLLVGHQPTLGLVAAQLLAGIDESWSIRKGAVWWLRRRERVGEGQGAQVVLQAVIGPELL
jgi:phosphohistidine phosphatase